MREKKPAAELEEMILKEVRNLPACQGLTGIRVGLVETTWRVNVYEGEPARPAECMDAISAIVYRLRGIYDLSSEG